MKQLFDKRLNTLTRGALLALFASGLALLSYAANESASKVPPALTSQSQEATNSIVISGEMMAHTCAACHGMPARQFITTMVDFREGKRPATLMGHVAQGFSDAEIRAMAQFFAAVQPQGSQP